MTGQIEIQNNVIFWLCLAEKDEDKLHQAEISRLTLRFFSQQTGEYATDEEDAGTTVPGGEKSIEVFDLPESEDILSPSELDATKLYQKFREVNSPRC